MERMDINNKKLVDDPFLLASWIAKSMAGELSDEELQLLDEWRMTSARNHQLLVGKEEKRNEDISRLLIKFPVGRGIRKN